MKKLPINKFRKQQVDQESSSRITNDTVAEHRERILAGGRKFKYPIQYARHKLVINALLVTLASFVVLALLFWWQLYIVQNSSTFIYRITRAIPLPVAVVDGEPVRFSDYLNQYRGSEFYLNKYDEIKLDSEDGKRQLDHIKRESMDNAVSDAYARQVARELKLTVSSDDIDQLIDQQRNTVNGRITQETYDASSYMMYGWTSEDYRSAVGHSILRARVSFAVDTDATNQLKQATELVAQTDGDFAKVAEQMKDTKGGKVGAGQSGFVNNVSTFAGLQVSEVAKLEQGKTSAVIKSTTDEGYYFVKVVEKTDTQVNFIFLHIPLTQFAKDLEALKKAGKVTEYIHIEEK